MTEEEKIKQIFSFKNIAVVGMSDNPEKPSNRVPAYLMKQGYKIIPVNPTKNEIMGLKSYKSLLEVEDEIDVVDVFRRPEQVLEVVRDAIERKKQRGDIKAIWLQEGIVNDEAKRLAEENGLLFIQDKCMFREHLRIKNSE
ncbi:MAG: CoA-binding protein [Candidatus Calescibacterium sp.]|jgi:predicted CoA-binding protein